MEKTDEIIASGIAKVVKQMDALTTEYGAATVELALFAVRLDAIRHVSIALIALLVGVSFIVAGLWRLRTALDAIALCNHEHDKYYSCRFPDPKAGEFRDNWEAAQRESHRHLARIFGFCIPGAILWTIGFAGVFSLAKWAAAFGYPEVYIATQALKSAGLL